MQTELKPAVKRFVEQMGIVSEAEGLPRIAGMIMGLMLATDETYGFDDLERLLRVSHGSVSTNARLLESLGVIERTSEIGDRRTYFRLTDDPYGRLLEGSLERMQHTMRIVEQGRRDIDHSRSNAAERLRSMAQFYELAVSVTRDAIEAWRRDRK